MMYISKTIRHVFRQLEDSPLTYPLWAASFIGIIIARLLIETGVGKFGSRSATFFFYEFTHTFLFFLLAYLLFLPLIKHFFQLSFQASAQLLLFGFLIILTPPLIDAWISHGQGFWSFYKFDGLEGLGKRFVTFFGDRPDIGITYGVRFEVACITLLLGLIALLRFRKWSHALKLALSAYILFFLLGTFPSWITLAFRGLSQGFLSIKDVDVASLFLSPPTLFSRSGFDIQSSLNIKMSLVYAVLLIGTILFGTWRFFPRLFWPLLHNARFPQLIYHGGLLSVGMGLALLFTRATLPLDLFNILAYFVALIAVGCAWIASVIANDLFDQNIDNITNPKRPLPTEALTKSTYRALGWTFFFVSLLFGFIVHPMLGLLLLAYQALAWIYSAPPLRLKRFPIVATFIAGVAGILILIAGFVMVAPSGNIASLPSSFLIFFLITYTFSLPLKDFKDIKGDHADGVYTLPVILGEDKAKLLIGSGIFLAFVVSTVILNTPQLFFWSAIFGGLAFWTLLSSREQPGSWLNYRLLPGWILSYIILYGCVIIFTLL